jgi:hypothetical protein
MKEVFDYVAQHPEHIESFTRSNLVIRMRTTTRTPKCCWMAASRPLQVFFGPTPGRANLEISLPPTCCTRCGWERESTHQAFYSGRIRTYGQPAQAQCNWRVFRGRTHLPDHCRARYRTDAGRLRTHTKPCNPRCIALTPLRTTGIIPLIQPRRSISAFTAWENRMQRMVSSVTDEVKQRVDVVEVISRYTQLKRAGSVYKGLCPFHSERTPSFVVFPNTGTWHCFGACGTGGDVICVCHAQGEPRLPRGARTAGAAGGIDLAPPQKRIAGISAPASTRPMKPPRHYFATPCCPSPGCRRRAPICSAAASTRHRDAVSPGLCADAGAACATTCWKGLQPGPAAGSRAGQTQRRAQQHLRHVSQSGDLPHPRPARTRDRLWRARAG